MIEAASRAAQPTATVVQLDGEIDIFTSNALRERLHRALQRSATPLVVDLSQVSFCDASGLAVLVGLQRRARARGIALHLRAPRAQMAKLLRVTGLDRIFMVYGAPSRPPVHARLVPAARTNRPVLVRDSVTHATAHATGRVAPTG